MKKLLIVVILVGSSLGCATAQPDNKVDDPTAINLPVLSGDINVVGAFHIEVFCSQTKPRTGMAKLSWRTDKRLFSKQRLDVTVYKQGFEKDLYTILWPIRAEQQFQIPRSNKLEETSRALALNAVNVNVDEKQDSIVVKLEGLEPGLVYFWRVCTLSNKGWRQSSVVRCEAPVCPADMKEEENQR